MKFKSKINEILYYLGSNAKNDAWSNAYNQHLYSDLTGTIRELTETDSNDDTDTRFQPPHDTNNQKIQPIGEGYRIANTELISPAISVSINKDASHERHKRDISSNDSSTTVGSLPSSTSITTEQASDRLSNNITDDEPIISESDANSWALSLSLAAAADGSGESKLLLSVLFFGIKKKNFRIF